MSSSKPDPTNHERADHIDRIIQEFLNNPAARETELIAAHPELMPELAEQLKVCRMVREAQAEANAHPASTQHTTPFDGPGSEDTGTTRKVDVAERAGTVIGRYKLLQSIGEGGFGVVYMAEQTEPVRRKVALKIIKPGMDTKDIMARFDAERHTLALMDHPNIARVLDAGATENGRPYFVME